MFCSNHDLPLWSSTKSYVTGCPAKTDLLSTDSPISRLEELKSEHDETIHGFMNEEVKLGNNKPSDELEIGKVTVPDFNALYHFETHEEWLFQLGVEIRLCIRDSLFRLAESALQRHCEGDIVSANKSRDDPTAITEERLYTSKSSARTPDGETKTNPLDRAVAHLLFHTPPELSGELLQQSSSAKFPLKLSKVVPAILGGEDDTTVTMGDVCMRNPVFGATDIYHHLGDFIGREDEDGCAGVGKRVRRVYGWSWRWGVGFLRKPDESAGVLLDDEWIEEYFDRVQPQVCLKVIIQTIYDSIVAKLVVKQFWQTATANTKADGSLEINATIDTIGYTITEASIRDSLQLEDATGITMLPNDELFRGMGQMGYPTDGTFTFWKSFFTPQWRYLVHHLLYCISSKSGGWDQFGSNIATALICLSTNRVYNFSKLIFDGMVANLKSKTKFLMYPRFLQIILNIQTENKHLYLAVSLTKKIFGNIKRGFRGAPRPLLPSMLLVATNPNAGLAHDAVAPSQPSSSIHNSSTIYIYTTSIISTTYNYTYPYIYTYTYP
ncbi:synaptobrevin, longin-like domain protein [Tanacetum coccineum]